MLGKAAQNAPAAAEATERQRAFVDGSSGQGQGNPGVPQYQQHDPMVKALVDAVNGQLNKDTKKWDLDEVQHMHDNYDGSQR